MKNTIIILAIVAAAIYWQAVQAHCDAENSTFPHQHIRSTYNLMIDKQLADAEGGRPKYCTDTFRDKKGKTQLTEKCAGQQVAYLFNN